MSADLAVIASEPSVLERVADPGEFLMLACERAKAWLAEALDHGEIDKIAEMRAQAEAIRVYTVSKQLGKDAQASAAEIVRRAERGLGLATRKGQAEGRIRDKGANGGPRRDYERNGRPVHVDPGNGDNKVSPGEYVGYGGTRVDIYAITDGVTDEGFDAIISEGRDEGDLTRRGIARKARQYKARQSADQVPDAADRTTAAVSRRRDLIRQWAGESYTSRQIAGRLGIRAGLVRRTAKEHGFAIPADAVVGRVHGIDPNRVVSETVGAMEGIASGLELVDAEDLDEARASEWAASLTQSVGDWGACGCDMTGDAA